MKHHLSLLLAFALTLSLSACGGDPNANTSASSSSGQDASQSAADSSASATDTSVQDPDASAQAPDTSVQEPETVTFDPGWAGADYQMPVPPPPFTAEVEFNPDRNRFTIRSVDAEEVAALPLESIAQYCGTLKALGYDQSLQERELSGGISRNGYEFYGEDGQGGAATLYDDSRGCMIMVFLPS